MYGTKAYLQEILEKLFEYEYVGTFYTVLVDPSKLINEYDVDPDLDWFDEGVYFDCGERMTYTKFSVGFRALIESILRKMDEVQDWNWEGSDAIEIAIMREVEENDGTEN